MVAPCPNVRRVCEDCEVPQPAQLRQARLAAGWTQDKVAHALCVTLRTVQHWEAGTRGMPAGLWKLLRRELDGAARGAPPRSTVGE